MSSSASYTVEQTSETKIKSIITLPKEMVEFMLSDKLKSPTGATITGTYSTMQFARTDLTAVHLQWVRNTTKGRFELSTPDHTKFLALLAIIKLQWQEYTTELPTNVTKALVSELNFQNTTPGKMPDLAHELLSMTTTLREACDSTTDIKSTKADTLKLLRMTTAIGVRAMITHDAPMRK